MRTSSTSNAILDENFFIISSDFARIYRLVVISLITLGYVFIIQPRYPSLLAPSRWKIFWTRSLVEQDVMVPISDEISIDLHRWSMSRFEFKPMINPNYMPRHANKRVKLEAILVKYSKCLLIPCIHYGKLILLETIPQSY